MRSFTMRKLIIFLAGLLIASQTFGAFPTVESVTESNESSSTTSHGVDYPATVDAGDLLIVLFSCDHQDCDPTNPAGFDVLTDFDGSLGDGFIVAKSAVGDEDGGTLTVTTSGSESSASQVLRITGWAGTVSTDVDCGTLATGTSSTPDPPSVTAGWGSDDNLFIEFVMAVDDDATVSSYSTSYTNGVDTVSGAIIDEGATAASARRDLAADNDNPGTVTLSESEAWGAQTCVVEPSAASGLILRRRTVE